MELEWPWKVPTARQADDRLISQVHISAHREVYEICINPLMHCLYCGTATDGLNATKAACDTTDH